MPAILSVSDLFEALGRNPEELIGEPETEWLDFKKESYFLDHDDHCFQLAKDVSAMANADEGLIVIGVETRRDENLMQEIADQLRPVAKGVIDPKRIQDVIEAWVYPRLDVEIRPHPVPNRPGDLWTILVKRQREDDLPFIVAREYVDSGGASRYAFAVYKRHSSDNRPYSPSQVHQWLHAGYGAPVGGERAVPDTSLYEQANAILEDDIAALGLTDEQVFYYIQARPTSAITIPRFYQGATGSVFDVLRRIPAIRPGGFNLADGDPQRPAWDGLRVVSPDDSSLSISRNGITTAIVGQSLLTWAAERFAPENQVWINPLALVEFTFEFWRFHVAQVIERTQHAIPVAWRIGMRNLGDPFPVLLPQALLRRLASAQEASPSASTGFDLLWSECKETEAGRLAFITLVEVYAKFGLGEDLIPCSEGSGITEGGILAATGN
jgi:hypothetical protein